MEATRRTRKRRGAGARSLPARLAPTATGL